jgi:hypothetical protein
MGEESYKERIQRLLDLALYRAVWNHVHELNEVLDELPMFLFSGWDIIRCCETPYTGIKILLANGANPNRGIIVPDHPILHRVVESCDYSLIEIFIHHPASDFNTPRMGYTPLMLFMQRRSGHTSDDSQGKICIQMYRRMSFTAISLETHLLHALCHHHAPLATLIIEEHDVSYIDGLYHLCIARIGWEGTTIVDALVARGYSRTDACPHLQFRQTNTRVSAMGACIFYRRWDIAYKIMPFAALPVGALLDIMYVPSPLTLIAFMRRINFRDVYSDSAQVVAVDRDFPEEHKRISYSIRPIIEAVAAHQHDNSPIRVAIDAFRAHGTCGPDPNLHFVWNFGPRPVHPPNDVCTDEIRDELICMLLRQGAVLDESMIGCVGLRGALQPWKPENTALFFHEAFKTRAFILLLAIEMCVDIEIPLEMIHRIVQFVDRRIECNQRN